MHLPRFSVVTAACLLIVTGMLAVSCSDDNNPAGSTGRWAWAPLGTGINQRVEALTVYDNKSIAAGFFTTAGGISANHIASWNGLSWVPLGMDCMARFLLSSSMTTNWWPGDTSPSPVG